MTEPTALATTGRGPDPTQALRAALATLAVALSARGAAPAQVAAMRWSAADPGAIHPARRAVDLAYRDVFGGVRPPVTLARSDETDGTVRVEATLGPAPAADPDLAEQIRGYSPRLQVPDATALFVEWRDRGTVFRRAYGALDLAYGPTPAETLDLYRPVGVARPPVWAFVHGGYWQATTRVQHAQFTAGLLAAGFAVANLDYGLAPEVSLDASAAQVRAALAFLVREADALDLDCGRLHLAGHSAGAHLAAMAALDPALPVGSALLLSGLFDLAPLAALPVGRLLGLDAPGTVGRLSPTAYPAPSGVRLGVAVGGGESAAFIDQSRRLAEAWGAPAPLVVPGADHFNLLEGLNGGPLLDLALATAAR